MSVVNLGTGVNTGTGDTLYTAFGAINTKFDSIDAVIEELAYDENSLSFRHPYIIYVSVDGDDSNNGHSFGEPVATVDKAIELANAIIDSEYTNDNPVNAVIHIAPGSYRLVNNPISVRHHVAIFGDNLRSVQLYPAIGREREGFFLVDDGFYMWGLTFRGHQADTAKVGWVVQLDYTANNTDRGATSLGAYITASPYFQNCSSITAEDDSGAAPSVSQGDTGGGILVDGNACADNSPLRSVVLDSFTQVNLGGIGCKVTNDGYAQLVSFFGTFCEYHVLCQAGGQVNFTGGTTDFGLYGLVADGYSPKPVFTAEAQREHYGAVRKDLPATIDNTTDVFTSVAHTFTNGDPVTVRLSGGDVPAPLAIGTIYYVINTTADTFQIAETVGGTAINITGDTTDIIYTVTTQGELYIDCVSFSESRLGTASQPYNGTLAFPVLTFPRTGSLAADTDTPGTVNTVEQDGNVYTAVAVLDTAPTSVGKHEYVPNTGTVTVTRPGAFVTPDGVLLEVTPIAGLNTYTFNLETVEYDHLTGITKFRATNYLPSASDIFYFTDAEFICPLSAYTVTSVQAINAFGLPVAFDSPSAAGFRVNLYNPINGGLIYPVTSGQKIDFRRRSQISAPSHVSEYVGSGMNYSALPDNGGRPVQSNLYQELNNGKVFITYTNEKGDFGVTNRFQVDGTTGEVTINASQFNLSGLNFIGPFSRNGGLTTVGVQIREASDNPNMISSLGVPDTNTVPTQTAVVGYIDRLFTGEGEIEALNVNGVYFTAAADESVYPLSRPQLVPFSFGDMIWDASLRAWLGWSGTNFSNELKVIVRKDGSVFYNFQQEARPLFRNEGEPTQTAIQNGDRWENPGEFIAYYNGTENAWVDVVASNLFILGTVAASTAFSPIYVTTTTTFSNVFVDSLDTYTLADPAGYLAVSTDYGATFSTFGDLSSVGAGTYYSFLRHTSTGNYLLAKGDSPYNYYSTDGGDTWTVIAFNIISNRATFVELSNGNILAFHQFGTAVESSADGGVTWTSLGNISPGNASDVTLMADNSVVLAHSGASRLSRSTDNGLTWSGVTPPPGLWGTDTRVASFGNRVYFSATNATGTPPTVYCNYTDDYGNTWVSLGPFIQIEEVDSKGSLLNRWGGVLNKSPSGTTDLSASKLTVGGSVYVQEIELTYRVLSGNNHDASNNMTVAFTVLDNDSGTATEYAMTLDNPYPSNTAQTEIIAINQQFVNGVTTYYNRVTVAGSPGEVNLTYNLKTRSTH